MSGDRQAPTRCYVLVRWVHDRAEKLFGVYMTHDQAERARDALGEDGNFGAIFVSELHGARIRSQA